MFESLKLDGLKGFVRTKAGKTALVGALVVMVLVVAGISYISLAGPAAPAGGSATTKAQVKTASAAQPVLAPEPMEPPVAVESFTQEQFRDPFKPIETTATSGLVPGQVNPVQANQDTQANDEEQSEPSEGGAVQYPSPPPTPAPAPAPTPAPQTTLSLLSITFKDGERVANLSLSGVEYTVKVGEQVGGSAFQVVEIGDETVTFLYGDDRIILAVGDTITK